MRCAIAATGFACLGFTCATLTRSRFRLGRGFCVRFSVGLRVRFNVCFVSLDVGFRVRCNVWCNVRRYVRRYVRCYVRCNVRRNVYCVSVRRLCVQVSSVVFAVVVHHRFVQSVINIANDSEQVASVILAVEEVCAVAIYSTSLSEVEFVQFCVLCCAEVKFASHTIRANLGYLFGRQVSHLCVSVYNRCGEDYYQCHCRHYNLFHSFLCFLCVILNNV